MPDLRDNALESSPSGRNDDSAFFPDAPRLRLAMRGDFSVADKDPGPISPNLADNEDE